MELFLLGVLAVFLKHVIGRETLLLDLSEGLGNLFFDEILYSLRLLLNALIDLLYLASRVARSS